MGALMQKVKQNSSSLISLAGLVLVFALFGIWSGGASLSEYNLRTLVNQGIVTAIVATGATFIFSMGMLDISLGATTCVAAVLGAHAANAGFGFVGILAVCIVTAVVVSAFSGMCITLFKLPAFIVTLAMMNILNAVASLLIGDNTTITIPGEFLVYDTLEVKLVCLAVVLVVCVFCFNFLKIGRRNKIIGGNQVNAVQSGIHISKSVIISFCISGLCVGIAAMVLLFRSGAASATTGSSLGFDIIIALVLGGMSIEGGARTKITNGLVGAFTITQLNNGLIIVGMPNGVIQAIRGVIFLIIVTLMALKSRTKYLA